MGYHATIPRIASSNSSENEINSESSDMITPPQPGKYFLVTGKDFPFCRKFYINCLRLLLSGDIYYYFMQFLQNDIIALQLNWQSLE